MGKKKEISLDKRIEDLKTQQEQVKEVFIELRGAIKILEQIKDEKTD
jgi:hypothetical protein